MPDQPSFRLPPWLCSTMLAHMRAMVAPYPAEHPHGFTIGAPGDPYLRRWFLLPRGDGPSCYLHQFLRDDDDRAHHDHPWHSVGVILKGGYLEHTSAGVFERQVGDVLVRTPEHLHRVVLHRDADGRPREAWTLFMVGERVRDWGFACPNGWVPWQEFCGVTPDGRNDGTVGKGCGE